MGTFGGGALSLLLEEEGVTMVAKQTGLSCGHRIFTKHTSLCCGRPKNADTGMCSPPSAHIQLVPETGPSEISSVWVAQRSPEAGAPKQSFDSLSRTEQR